MPSTSPSHTLLLLPEVTRVEELCVPHQSPRGTQAEGSTQVEQLQQLNLRDGTPGNWWTGAGQQSMGDSSS